MSAHCIHHAAPAVALLATLLTILGFSGRCQAAQAATEPEYLVGIYYFAGWWRKSPNKWETGGRDWRPDYPERIPTLGEYNDQETMDREIMAASSHGVSFFQ